MDNDKSSKIITTIFKYGGYDFLCISLIGIILTITTQKNYVIDIVKYLSIGLCLILNTNEKKNTNLICVFFILFVIMCIFQSFFI